MKTTKAILILAGALFLLFYPVSSKADPYTFDLDVPNSNLSAYTGPYAKVEVTLLDAFNATVKFTRYDSFNNFSITQLI